MHIHFFTLELIQLFANRSLHLFVIEYIINNMRQALL